MREYELIVDKALGNGLSPELSIQFNAQVLYDCLGFRCGKAGLESYIEGSNTLPSALDMYYNWPFPQSIVGERYNFLVIRDSHRDHIYTFSDDASTVSLINSIHNDGTLMEVADFGEYAFMTNGYRMIYWNTVTETWNSVNALANIPMMRTVCNLNGQAVGGNIVSDWYDCDETYYVWSKIGEMNFTPSSRNEAGYRRCPFGGVVHNVRKLGNMAVGYSSKGITFIKPVRDPAATFGFLDVGDIGIVNQGAVAGDFRRHVYVGSDFIVREVTPEGINELGYQNYISQLGTDESIIVTYDKSEKDFYIGNSIKTFILSSKGLTETVQHPSAVWRSASGTLCMLPDSVDDSDLLIISWPFDMGYRGLKTVSTIETDLFLTEGLYAGVDYTYDLKTWQSGEFTPVNDQGIATINMTGNAFRLKLKMDSIYSGLKIGYIKARYKMADLRGIRGVYAPPPRGQ